MKCLLVALFLLVTMLGACGPMKGPEPVAEFAPTATVVATPTAISTVIAEASQTEAPVEAPQEDAEPVEVELLHEIREAVPVLPGFGDSSIEEKISTSDIIVRADLISYSIKAVQNNEGAYSRAIYFELTVHEYLLGSGPTNIVAVWVDVYDYAADEIEEGLQNLRTHRDARWDLREAIIFLRGNRVGPYWTDTELATQLALDTHYLLSFGFWHGEDLYSIGSERDRRWLPSTSASSGGASGDSETESTYLLMDPSSSEAIVSGESVPTISLTELKSKITQVTGKLQGGDGSDRFEECVEIMYDIEQQTRYHEDRGDTTDAFGRRPMETEIISGQPAGYVVLERDNYALSTTESARSWIEGRDKDLFAVNTGPYEPYTEDDEIEGFLQFDETFVTTRPLIPGAYEIELKEIWWSYAICDGTVSLDWTVTVASPEGIAHELWLETAWDDGANAADSTVGTLTPSAFGAGTIDRIAYVPDTGKVSITATPATLLDGHTLDFMRNDGSVALILHAEDATRDGSTLTWSKPKPWSNGDELFVTIRPTMQSPSNVQAAYADGEITVSWGGAENATGIILFLDSVGGSLDRSQRADIDATATSHTFTIEHSGHYAVTVVAQQMYRNAAYDKHVALEPMEVTIE